MPPGQWTSRPATGSGHWLPSPQAFVDAALCGMGWGMNPERLVRPALQAGRLIDLAPDKPIDVMLYWQCWRLNVASIRELTRAVQAAAAAELRQ